MNLQRWKFNTPQEDVAQSMPAAHPGVPHPVGLSGRALNVLKVLSTELTDEIPPKGAWDPPDDCRPQHLHAEARSWLLPHSRR